MNIPVYQYVGNLQYSEIFRLFQEHSVGTPPRALESLNIGFFSASSNSKEHARFEAQPRILLRELNPISHVDDGDMDLIGGGNQDPGAGDGNESDICLVKGCQDVGALPL